ncbi:MAG: hypothetical protein HQL69_02405 [Magnetococcales bacterium]|nr:hypothetical protein [Magnetococcales bacterium]
MSWKFTINGVLERFNKAVSVKNAKFWQLVYRSQHQLKLWKLQYGDIYFYITLVVLMCGSFYLSSTLQQVLLIYFPNNDKIELLRTLMLNVGSALIGASVIVTSLVLFAMQTNIDRMPYGLFRRLSEDRQLLGAFMVALLLAIGITIISIFVDKTLLSLSVLTACWAVTLIFISFIYAYRRALVLVNPIQQLNILIQDTRKEFIIWSTRARRARPLLEQQESMSTTSSASNSTHDMALTTFFQINKHWTNGAKQDLQRVISFAQRYAENGDYDVSREALNAVIIMNSAYIDSKGKTFFSSTPFVENPLSNDEFINITLEHLRQVMQSGIARKDEQKIDQTLRSFAALIKVYLGIDYSNPHASKSHAQLAASYLASSVQDIIPYGKPDVLMTGQRLMGTSAQQIIYHGDLTDITLLTEKIALIACTGCAKEELRPVMMEGMSQLADLTFDLLRLKTRDISFTIKEVGKSVALVASLYLKMPDAPLSSHSTYLGPYYSSTSMQSLIARLIQLVNALLQAKSDDKNAQVIIRNIECWVDGLYRQEKELLLEAVKAKSHFAFDMMHWITGLTDILLATSKAPACGQHFQDKLQKHASNLIMTFSWIPDNKDTVNFLENYQMTETLFEAAINANNRGCNKISKDVEKILLSWAFKAGKYQTGWNVLKIGLCGLAAIAVNGGDEEIAQLKSGIKSNLTRKLIPDHDILHQTAKKILERAANLNRQGYRSSHIDRIISQSDHKKLRPFLEEIAYEISPSPTNN